MKWCRICQQAVGDCVHWKKAVGKRESDKNVVIIPDDTMNKMVEELLQKEDDEKWPEN